MRHLTYSPTKLCLARELSVLEATPLPQGCDCPLYQLAEIHFTSCFIQSIGHNSTHAQKSAFSIAYMLSHVYTRRPPVGGLGDTVINRLFIVRYSQAIMPASIAH